MVKVLVVLMLIVAAHERSALEHVTKARATRDAATGGKSVAQRSAAERELDSAVSEVVALGQTYQRLRAPDDFLDLQRNLADTEDKLAFAGQHYDDAVDTFNRQLATSEWMYVAEIAGVSQREYYQASR